LAKLVGALGADLFVFLLDYREIMTNLVRDSIHVDFIAEGIEPSALVDGG
jgi:hypothetical protein